MEIGKTLHLSVFLAVMALVSAVSAGDVSKYDVEWDSPSADSHGSMPLGNGDVGLNVWVEKNGDLVFYISKTDSWDCNGRLLKIGKVRIKFDPGFSVSKGAFRQKLDLSKGCVEVWAPDSARQTSNIRVWVDANNPVVEVELDFDEPVAVSASVELWRLSEEKLAKVETGDPTYSKRKPQSSHVPISVEPDIVFEKGARSDEAAWCHWNSRSVGPKILADIQGVSGFKRPDPLLHRTFGAVLRARGARRKGDCGLFLAPAKHHRLGLCVLTAIPSTPEKWLADAESLFDKVEKKDSKARWEAHVSWWKAFWNRSWIEVDDGKGSSGDAYIVSRAYALQRFITACGGRGRYPIKFNGSIFTVPYEKGPGDADYRRWGAGYWWQNTRLPYYPMCAAGDFEMMEPLFRMYVDDILPLNKYRTKRYFGFDNAAYFVECVTFWGDVIGQAYGWTPKENRSDPLQKAGWHKWEWVAGPELVCMMLDLYNHTGDSGLLRKRIVPAAMAIFRFFDHYYKTGPDGKLRMTPSQACETWWKCVDPMPEVAGLRASTERLLALPEEVFGGEDRKYVEEFRAKLPPLPTRKFEDGSIGFAPAMEFAKKKNCENPELYAIFPFRLCTARTSNLKSGLRAFSHRKSKFTKGWGQDGIDMAYLGLTEDARKALVSRANAKCSWERFPAFWGPNFDWTPDQTHGGVLMKILQSMLLQTDIGSEKIYLLPAWPKDWKCDFKLHAPHGTVVSGRVENGDVKNLKVEPEERRKDVVF